jgi:hypothetical protein
VSRLAILVAGRLAGIPHQGGATWAVLQFLLGLHRLGHQVHFVEPVPGDALGGRRLRHSASAAYFREVVGAFGLQDRATLLEAGTRRTVGVGFRRAAAFAERADLVLNLSGVLAEDELLGPVPTRVYVDLDPGFTQLWQVSGIDMGLDLHTHFVTLGRAVGDPGCPVPVCGRRWIPTFPPVVLERWPQAPNGDDDRFTTVGNWRSYGSLAHEGVFYGQKAHSFRALLRLAALSPQRFLLALAIHPEELDDLAALTSRGWELANPAEVAGDPQRYWAFVQGSKGELAVAKLGYVVSGSGWFSDRSACYLASGRPVIGQETGFSAFLPTGRGLLSFETPEEAAEAVEKVNRDYARHRRAARAIAREFLDSDTVLMDLVRCL